MGVPAFFRWLSRKYPSVVANCVEITPVDEHGRPVPVNCTEPNPNGVEFDNLYLDMNGIIHPCTHPEDRPPPKDEDEMMIAIFECIDRMLSIVRPRKVLYMAIDGVAPRAKMNQQRSRRFRASKETAEKIQEIAKVRAELEEKGVLLPPLKEAGSHFDSNCITPGTPFMGRLSKCLHYYAHDRLNSNPAWKNVKVILSDANVPGEGEHKIMDFIRKQRSQPDHDPNTRHCLCGADADLMMLGLATHEPNFTIIREEFRPNADRPCDVCGKLGHVMKDCCGLDSLDEEPTKFATEMQYIFVRLNVLREYLKRELSMPGLPFEYDFERALDDWVFMCFFVGNDFLPHLPSLEIREGAIDRLIGLYKKCVYKTGGYLTENGSVNLDRVQLIMSDLGVVEDEIFKKRHQTELHFKSRDKFRRQQAKRFKKDPKPARILDGQYAPMAIGRNVTPMVNPRAEIYSQRVQSMHTGANSGGSTGNNLKRKREDNDDDDDDSSEEEVVNDEVRLYEAGFKDRYYESKFDVSPENKQFRYKVGFEYVRGLCWVLHYYYQGCPSWKWYFPYHYAPFASDFVNIGATPIVFEKGTKPFKPLEQLMGVFPAASKSHVPEPWSKLMCDPDSPIIDFYPEDFKIDLNGKKFAWQGVALLPFADESRLFEALAPIYDLLTDDERERNTLGDDRIYIPENNAKYRHFQELSNNIKNCETESTLVVDHIACTVLLASDSVEHGGTLSAPVAGLEPVTNNAVLCFRYRDINYGENHIYPATRLPLAEDPPTVLKPENLSRQESASYRPQIGMTRTTTIAKLGVAGHRTLQFHNTYSNAPPPVNYNQGNRGYNDNKYGGNQQQSSNYGRDNYNRSGNFNRYNSNDSRDQRRGNQRHDNNPSFSRGGYVTPQNYNTGGYSNYGNRYQDNNRNFRPNNPRPMTNVRPPSGSNFNNGQRHYGYRR